jgi:hypothetical protein
VNQANFVRFGESIGNLCRNGDGPAKRNRARGQQTTHRFPIHQFHGNVARAVHVPEFIDGDVMPRSFEFPLDTGRLSHSDLWVPMSFTPVEKKSEGLNFD